MDAGCRKLTASWVRAIAVDNSNIETCPFYEGYEKKGAEALLPSGVYTLHDLRGFGREKGWCPYFLARHMIQFANVIVYNYQYLLDPKVSESLPPVTCFPLPPFSFLSVGRIGSLSLPA